MRIDAVSGALLHPLEERIEPDVADLDRPAAARTDDVMVMRGRLAGDVGVLAAGQVDPFDQPQSGHRLERAEHGGAAHRMASAPAGNQHVLGGEVTVVRGDRLAHRASGAGDPQAGTAERGDDHVAVYHGPMLGAAQASRNRNGGVA